VGGSVSPIKWWVVDVFRYFSVNGRCTGIQGIKGGKEADHPRSNPAQGNLWEEMGRGLPACRRLESDNTVCMRIAKEEDVWSPYGEEESKDSSAGRFHRTRSLGKIPRIGR